MSKSVNGLHYEISEGTDLDPQASDHEHRTQQDAMRATIARLMAENKALQDAAKQLLTPESTEGLSYNPTAVAVANAVTRSWKYLSKENARLRKELNEAITGRDAEYNRAEKEREQANEWLAQLTDAKAAIEAARGLMGAAPLEALGDVTRRVCRLAFYPLPAGASKLRQEIKRLRVEKSQTDAMLSDQFEIVRRMHDAGAPYPADCPAGSIPEPPLEPGTLAEIFSRSEPATSKGRQLRDQVISL